MTLHCPTDMVEGVTMLDPVKGEPIVTDAYGGRWEYVHDTDDGHNKYLHCNCDAVCNREGFCIRCNAPCPTVWSTLTLHMPCTVRPIG